ncbi:MAG: glutaredoxin family protein [Bacteroidales bacterium]
MKRIATVLLFTVFLTNGFSQTDSLVLFTKPGCSNCNAAKLQLHQNRIAFKEHSLESDNNGRRMLQLLAKAGYKERIYLPVILLNNRLYHPAYQSDTGLATMALPDVVDSLVARQKRGALHLPIEIAAKRTETTAAIEHSAECEVNASTFYLINSTFATEPEAKAEMNRLIKEGYIYAGFLFTKGKYQVYSKFFFDKAMAESELQRAKLEKAASYLIEVK